jgi:hypothetical protein
MFKFDLHALTKKLNKTLKKMLDVSNYLNE